jgi:hypothetical protein
MTVTTPANERLAMALIRARNELGRVLGEVVPGSITDEAARSAARAIDAAAGFAGELEAPPADAPGYAVRYGGAVGHGGVAVGEWQVWAMDPKGHAVTGGGSRQIGRVLYDGTDAPALSFLAEPSVGVLEDHDRFESLGQAIGYLIDLFSEAGTRASLIHAMGKTDGRQA